MNKENLTKDLLEIFSPDEGFIHFYYGRIRNGKTYAATADILELISRGEIVYANWKINFDEFELDDRKKFGYLLMKFLTGRKYYFKYSSQNFHYFSPDDIDIGFLGRLVGVHIFIDEGQWLFNSHARMTDKKEDVEKRKLILHNGHYARSLNIISQRASNVMKDYRSQVHVWYRCRKLLSWPVLLFCRERIEDMKDDLPDEETIGWGDVKVYFADDRVKRAYSTHAMRASDSIVPERVLEVFEYGFFKRLYLLLQAIWVGAVRAIWPAYRRERHKT